MTELFPEISEEARKQAELAWVIARSCKTPVEASNMLDSFTNFYCSISKEENIREFLNFFFNTKLEELKNENSNTER